MNRQVKIGVYGGVEVEREKEQSFGCVEGKLIVGIGVSWLGDGVVLHES